MRHIKTLTNLLLHPATGEGWDGGDAEIIYASSIRNNPPSQPSPIFMGEGADRGFGHAARITQPPRTFIWEGYASNRTSTSIGISRTHHATPH
jgi:hypothetical protein